MDNHNNYNNQDLNSNRYQIVTKPFLAFSNNQPKARQCTATDYPSLLGDDSWQRLHPDIQRRFAKGVVKTVTYQGIMSEVYLSFAGRLFAHVCRLIGTPLALFNEKDVPVIVKVYRNEKLGGITWDRFYQYAAHPMNRVKSTKCIQQDGRLVEMVGFGFGMKLAAYEKQGALCFASSRFFWQLGKLRINIPNMLSPGRTVVTQRALDNGQFEFRLESTHPLLGNIFKQVGVFGEVKGR